MNTDKAYAEKIASEYAPKETRKVVALKKLDNRAKRPANVFAYTFGVVMALLLGVGMCLSMKVLGDGSTLYTVLGVVVGVIGIVGVSVNYAIYRKLLDNSKKKYSADIIALANQIAAE
jgi:Superfamily II RNA helicase